MGMENNPWLSKNGGGAMYVCGYVLARERALFSRVKPQVQKVPGKCREQGYQLEYVYNLSKQLQWDELYDAGRV